MTPVTILAALAASFFLSYVLTGVLRSYALKKSLIDVPNDRSSHKVPTPRGGGVAFCLTAVGMAIVLGLAGFMGTNLLGLMIPGAVLVSLVGFADDHYNLRARVRFLFQLLAAVLFLIQLGGWGAADFGAVRLSFGIFGAVIGVVGIVWSVNLFNFMDGTDTFAAMEAVCVLLYGAFFFWQSNGEETALLALVLAAAIAGFSIWNLPPARIFMGDAGSYFAGFFIGAFALVGEIQFGIPVFVWVILYGVFWFDATATLLRRVARGEQWHSAHRLHAYQRLHQSGWSHGKVSLAALGLNLLLGAIAVWGFYHPPHLPWAFIVSLILLVAAYGAVEYRKPMWAGAKQPR